MFGLVLLLSTVSAYQGVDFIREYEELAFLEERNGAFLGREERIIPPFSPEDTQYKNLRELAHLIIEIIQAKPEYQELAKPKAGYA